MKNIAFVFLLCLCFSACVFKASATLNVTVENSNVTITNRRLATGSQNYGTFQERGYYIYGIDYGGVPAEPCDPYMWSLDFINIINEKNEVKRSCSKTFGWKSCPTGSCQNKGQSVGSYDEFCEVPQGAGKYAAYQDWRCNADPEDQYAGNAGPFGSGRDNGFPQAYDYFTVLDCPTGKYCPGGMTVCTGAGCDNPLVHVGPQPCSECAPGNVRCRKETITIQGQPQQADVCYFCTAAFNTKCWACPTGTYQVSSCFAFFNMLYAMFNMVLPCFETYV